MKVDDAIRLRPSSPQRQDDTFDGAVGCVVDTFQDNVGASQHRLEAHARLLRATVLQWTGVPVSVGIAPIKTLVKVANRTAKRDPASKGVCVLLTREA